MHRRDFVISTSVSVAGLAVPSSIVVQKKPSAPDLAALAEGKGLQVFNRILSVLKTGRRKARA
jgi:hypothetical protein